MPAPQRDPYADLAEFEERPGSGDPYAELAEFEEPTRAGSPTPEPPLTGLAAYGSSGPSMGEIEQGIDDWKERMVPTPKPGDAPVSMGRTAALSLKSAFIPPDPGRGVPGDRAAGVPLGLVGKLGGTPGIEPPNEQQFAASEAELDRAAGQNPVTYYGTQLLAGGADALASGGARVLNAVGGGLRDLAVGSQRRALGYKAGQLGREELEGANRVAGTVLDEMQPGALEGPGALRGRIREEQADVGGQLTRTRADMTAQGDGVHLDDFLRELQQIKVGTPGTTWNAEQQAAVDTIARNATALADKRRVIPMDQTLELKKQLSAAIEAKGPGGIPDASGTRAIEESARRRLRPLEDQAFATIAPEAVAQKRLIGDLKSADKALTGRITSEAVQTQTPVAELLIGGSTALGAAISGMGISSVLAAPLGIALTKAIKAQGNQATATIANAAGRIARSRFAPVLEQMAQTAEPAKIQVAVNALLRTSPEFQALVYGASSEEDEPPAEVPPTPSDERVKESVQPLDSKAVLRRYVQVQAAKRPKAAQPTASAETAAPPEKRREAYAMKHEGGRLRSIEGARRRITIVRDEAGLPVSMDVEDL